MALGVEVGHVVGTLEVEAAEALETDVDPAADDGVENGNAVFAADLFDRLDRLPVHRLRDVPRGDEANLGGGEFLLQAGAENGQFGAEKLCSLAVALHEYGVVMAADNDHIVSRIREGGVALAEGWTELLRFPLIGDAAAVPAPVVVLHVVFAGQLVVPGVFDGIGGILDVAVAENDDVLAVEWGLADGFRGIKSRLGQPYQLLLRESIYRQE